MSAIATNGQLHTPYETLTAASLAVELARPQAAKIRPVPVSTMEPADLAAWLVVLHNRLAMHGTLAGALAAAALSPLIAQAEALATPCRPLSAAEFVERRGALAEAKADKLRRGPLPVRGPMQPGERYRIRSATISGEPIIEGVATLVSRLETLACNPTAERWAVRFSADEVPVARLVRFDDKAEA